MEKERFVVIGGVAAGMSAASRAKRKMPEMEVTVLERGSFVSFRHEATRIDPKAKAVFARDLDSGEEMELAYDRLAICTGASPSRPAFPGGDLENVFVIRTAEDGIALKSFIMDSRPKRAAIIGAGLIGLEMAESLKENEVEVLVIKRPGSILRMFDDDMAEIVEGELRENGVELIKEAKIQRFEGNKKGLVSSVVLEDSRYDVDLVLLAAGATPNSSLAKEAGITVAQNGTIVVDQWMRTSDGDIFAAGDCVGQKHMITGKDVYIPRGTTANKQGRIAGENAAGGDEVFGGVLGTAVSKIFGLTVARTGLSSAEAASEGFDVITSSVAHPSHGDTYPDPEPEDMTIKLIVERTGRLLGAQMIGRIGVAKRIDVFATALYNRMTVDQISNLDLCYSPPYAPVWDPILVAANVAQRKLT
jgi:NADPH-dependent 2,4-dienoyl-CoA reductase/sulfur reductase-like enzyme